MNVVQASICRTEGRVSISYTNDETGRLTRFVEGDGIASVDLQLIGAEGQRPARADNDLMIHSRAQQGIRQAGQKQEE